MLSRRLFRHLNLPDGVNSESDFVGYDATPSYMCLPTCSFQLQVAVKMNSPVATMRMQAVGTSEIPVVPSVSMWCLNQCTTLYRTCYFVFLITATATVRWGGGNF